MVILGSGLSSLALWRDRSGAFSTPRALALALAVLPALPLLLRVWQQDLGPRPLTEISHQTGLWAVRLLAVTLAITPLIAALRRPKLIAARRILGVSVFAWMIVHLVVFFADKMFDPIVFAREIVLRFYLLIGFVAFLMLCALAATSTDAAIRRLGAERWKRLHLLTYAVAALGLAHFFMQSKSDISEPFAMTGVFALLGMLRLPKVWRRPLTAPVILASSVLAAATTAAIEAAWFWWKMGAPFAYVLESNFDLSLGLRPCWWPLIAGIALATLTLAANAVAQSRPAARATTNRRERSAMAIASERRD